ncbi:MarR family winged helix-turn-helix transcriptional regulator [Pseudomonas putida]|uniref:MarR family winged helix-turn-helix transcriptional regulator n=1 Tax=Pseudomonas putida TaxID=303 RepID=UPI0009BBD241|nr:MarR family transcriptional regulator [Pseudomonas putida]
MVYQREPKIAAMVKQTSSLPTILHDGLGYALRRAHTRLSQQLAKQLEDIHLSTSQFYTLLLIYQYDGVCQAEVARLLDINPSQLVPLIQNMEKRGLIRKTQEQEDKRLYHLHISAAGASLIERSLPLVKACELFVTSALSDEERQSLLRLMQEIKVPERPYLSTR